MASPKSHYVVIGLLVANSVTDAPGPLCRASSQFIPPTLRVLAKRVHKVLKTKGERYKKLQRVQKWLKILKMSPAEVE